MIEFFTNHHEIIRNLSLFIFGLIGTSLAIKVFYDNVRQRKLENTFKLVEFMQKHISEADISTIVRLFHANNPLAGHPDLFIHEDGIEEQVIYMFSEGGSGNGDVHNALEVFNLISNSLIKKTVVVEIIWYEYGQLMGITNDWLIYIEKHGPKFPVFDNDEITHKTPNLWPKFREFMNNHKPHYDYPMKYYTYAE